MTLQIPYSLLLRNGLRILLRPDLQDAVMTEGEHGEEEGDCYVGQFVDELGDLVESAVTVLHCIDEILDTHKTVNGRKDECKDECEEQESAKDLASPEIVDQCSDHQHLTDGTVDAHDIGLDDLPSELLGNGEIEWISNHEIHKILKGEDECESDHRICLRIESCLFHGRFGVEYVDHTEDCEQQVVCELDDIE